jgi:hypothetical protein
MFSTLAGYPDGLVVLCTLSPLGSYGVDKTPLFLRKKD